MNPGFAASRLALSLALIILFSAFTLVQAEDAPSRLRLTITEDGQALLDGSPWRGVGVNFFSAFRRTLDDPEDHSYVEGFRELADYRIP